MKKKHKKFIFVLPDDDREKLEFIAKRLERSFGDSIRNMIREKYSLETTHATQKTV